MKTNFLGPGEAKSEMLVRRKDASRNTPKRWQSEGQEKGMHVETDRKLSKTEASDRVG
jgi:hypothetical protein